MILSHIPRDLGRRAKTTVPRSSTEWSNTCPGKSTTGTADWSRPADPLPIKRHRVRRMGVFVLSDAQGLIALTPSEFVNEDDYSKDFRLCFPAPRTMPKARVVGS
jgi:hypothetical protein